MDGEALHVLEPKIKPVLLSFKCFTPDFMQDFEGVDDSSDDEDEAQMAAFLEQGDFYKMVFVVNMELNMGVGKVAAQVGTYMSTKEWKGSRAESCF